MCSTTARRPTSTSAITSGSPTCKLTRLNNLTSGQVYQTVLNNEREGKYLGKTVQVIPHVTDEIKNRIHLLAEQTKADVIITEIGGTTGDIEGLPFLEAIREFALEVGLQQRDFHARHLRAVHQGRRRIEDQADAAIRRQAARNRHRAAHPGLPLRKAAGQGIAPENFPVLQRAGRGGHRGKGRGPFHLRGAADAPARARWTTWSASLLHLDTPPRQHDALAGNHPQAHRAAASRAHRRRRQIHRPAGRLQIGL